MEILTLLIETSGQQQDLNTLLLMVLSLLMVGRAVDKYFENKNK